jgi:hypothetical protein
LKVTAKRRVFEKKESHMKSKMYQVVLICALMLAAPGCTPRRVKPATPALPLCLPVMVVDQANTAIWNRAWTVASNDLRQTFIPALPFLMAVEVDLVLGNPGPASDRVSLTIYDANGSDIASVSQDVSAAGVDRVRFVFPHQVAVTIGQTYAIRVSSHTTFGWKYVVGGYERGAGTFNGRPLLNGTRATFLFRTLGSN